MARLAWLLGGSLLLAGTEPEGVSENPARTKTPSYTVTPTEIFVGSSIKLHEESGERRYTANQNRILVSIWPNPTTVIQYGLPGGTPYEGEEPGTA